LVRVSTRKKDEKKRRYKREKGGPNVCHIYPGARKKGAVNSCTAGSVPLKHQKGGHQRTGGGSNGTLEGRQLCASGGVQGLGGSVRATPVMGEGWGGLSIWFQRCKEGSEMNLPGSRYKGKPLYGERGT